MQNLKELNAVELNDINGGFVPIVWAGAVILSSGTVKTLFVAGMAAGVAGATAFLD
tara:strand:- start:427 stop:594 length:168 start_codon:yes stop_codon:yes gene_type:complete